MLPLKGKTVLITAGPTYEAIDPVRFIGNRSSGKMGYALAISAQQLGAKVHLISGPTGLPRPENVNFYRVETSDQMFAHADQLFEQSDIVILSAAVADYKPKVISSTKIKKTEPTFHLELEKTIDIAFELGKKKTNQLLIGFALETNDEEKKRKK